MSTPSAISHHAGRPSPSIRPAEREERHIELLRGLPLPPDEIALLTGRLNRGLLPLQQRALSESLLSDGQSLLVSAPTSSGKTLIAELACRMAMARGRRAVYLAPTRALAEEVAAAFRRWMSGRRVVVATREHPEGSALFAQSAFDLAVTIPEKLLTLLMQGPQLAGDIGLVVADELELIGEARRGADLDLLLTFMRRCPGIQLLGLAPLLTPSAGLAQWFGGMVLRDAQRPHPLREGVLDIATGLFHYRETCGEKATVDKELLLDDADALPADPADDYRAAVLELVYRWSLQGRRGLVFVPRRDTAQAWATHLACCLTDSSFCPSDAPPLADDSMLSEALEPCLKAGIGFHHAEMPARVRHRVEDMARNGELCVIFATGTLGAGVNLPAEYVISMPGTLIEARPSESSQLIGLSARRFRNQGGRAGRFGHLDDDMPGRSMVLVQGDTERRQAWNHLIETPPTPLTSSLQHEPLEASVLRLLALGVPGSPDVMHQFLGETLAGWTHWRAQSSFAGAVTDALDALAAQGLAAPAGERSGHLVATTLGRVTASSGISFQTAFALRDWLRSAGDDMPCRLEMLAMASLLPDAMALPIRLSAHERMRCNYARSLRARLPEPARERLKASLQPEGGLRAGHLTAAKRALALADWLGTDTTTDLERRYEMYAGAFQGAALDVQWLIEAAAMLDEALGGPPERVALLRQLAQGLPLGIGPEFHALTPLRRVEPSRAELHHIIREGLTSVEALADIEPGFLAPAIAAPRAAQMVAAAVDAMAARRRLAWQPGLAAAPQAFTRSSQAPVGQAATSSTGARAPILRLVRGGSRAWFRGQAADLPPTAAEMLLLLATRRGQVVRFEELMHALWNSPPEQRQVHQHKRAILTAAEPHLNQDELRMLVETVRGNGLRMNLPEQEVAIANY